MPQINYHYLKVNPLLSDYIRTVLVLEDGPPAKRNSLPLFTNGTPVLISRTGFKTRGSHSVPHLLLFGKSAPADAWSVRKNETLIAYFFRPFMMSCLSDIPAGVLVERDIALSDWNNPAVHALSTQLACAENTSEKIKSLDTWLLHQAELQKKECKIILHATDAMIQDPDKDILSDILDDLHLNERTFQRIFKKYVGITPTHYRRICLFKASFDRLKGAQNEKLSEIAYRSGFADQSHFIRSFREHTQTTPKEYVRTGLKKK
jgi:AraC-like DNA-binding protein